MCSVSGHRTASPSVPISLLIAMARITLRSVLALVTVGVFQVATASPARRDLSQYTAQQIVDKLGLTPWQSGYNKETYRDRYLLEDPYSDQPNGHKERSIGSAMFYLLEGSAGWSETHCLDSTTSWHFYGGAPIIVNTTQGLPTAVSSSVLLGPDIFNGQQLQTQVGEIQCHSLKSQGDWSLLGINCKHSPPLML